MEKSLVKTGDTLFPPMPLEEWEATKDTLHLYLQIVGKIKLALMPRRNHWWNITFQVYPRGLQTGPIPFENQVFEILFDFFDHKLLINTSNGKQRSFRLHDGLSVSDFYSQVLECLQDFNIFVKIKAVPYLNKSSIPFKSDLFHKSYNPEYISRYHSVMVSVDSIFRKFAGDFCGKSSPVQLFWHSLDLVVTRFSGKKAPEIPAGSVPDKEAYSHEVVSFGFWPGDTEFRQPAFYSYTWPSPKGLENVKLSPKRAYWTERNDSPLAILNYADMRESANPEKALMEFLESAYNAGAYLAGWDMDFMKTRKLE